MNKPEEQECKTFADWLVAKRLKFSHIVNEVKGTNREQAMRSGARLKKLGKSPGIPDYVVLTPKGIVWVEMKDPAKKLKNGDVMEGWTNQLERGGLKRDQYDWINAINKTPGSQAAVCYGASEAITFVERFLT